MCIGYTNRQKNSHKIKCLKREALVFLYHGYRNTSTSELGRFVPVTIAFVQLGKASSSSIIWINITTVSA